MYNGMSGSNGGRNMKLLELQIWKEPCGVETFALRAAVAVSVAPTGH